MGGSGTAQALRTDGADRALLHALGRLVVAEISADELLTRIVDTARELLGADRATLYRIDHARHELVSVAAHLPEMPVIRLAIGDGIAGHVARTGELVRTDACDKNAHFEPKVDRATGYVTRSMIAAPVDGGDGDRIGVLQVLNKLPTGGFHDDDQQTIEVLARQAGLLLEEAALSANANDGAGGGEGSGALGRRGGPDFEAGAAGEPALWVGNCRRMQRVVAEAQAAARHDEPVLLLGGPGVGKSTAARVIHATSARRHGPLVHLDCAAHAAHEVEVAIFGAGRHAGPGIASRPGHIERARGGVLHLAEFQSLSSAAQDRLLGLVEGGAAPRVGGWLPVSADVRLVFSSRRSLTELTHGGGVRPELIARLRGSVIEVPPLARRGWGDLRALADHFVATSARRHRRAPPRWARDSFGALMAWHWPGNVRELESCIETAVMRADDIIRVEHLPIPAGRSGRDGLASNDAFEREPALRELERRYISWMLQRCEGNRSLAARKLGIGRNTLHRKLHEFGLAEGE